MASKLLKYLIADEKQAPITYRKLLKQTKDKQDKKVIRGIIKQEQQHRRKLLKFK